MPKINVNDISLYYEIYGQGTPIVFITGFNGDHLIWQNIIETFAKQYQVIVFDNRGSGQSGCPDIPYTVELMAQDTDALCEALSIRKAYFVGLSLGGAILQCLIKNHPSLVHAAVLNNTFFKIQSRFTLYAQASADLFKTKDKLVSRELDTFLAKIGLTWGFSNAFLNNSENVETLVNIMLNNPFPITEIGFKNQLHALTKFDSSSWISEIKTPSLVIGSNEDAIVTSDHFQLLAQKLPNAEYYEFQSAGHLPHIEATEKYIKIVTEFFQKHKI